MSTEPNLPADTPLRQELQHMREAWLLLLILGIALVIVGVLAIISAFVATMATMAVFGSLLFVGGILQLVNALTCRNWRGFFLFFIAAICYSVLGLIMMSHPLAAAAAVTLMIAAALMIGGMIRIVIAVLDRFYGWPWVLIDGFITLILGIFIWKHFPEDAAWIIGIFIGVNLILAGWSWIFLALGIRTAFPSRP
jgi:uncharacterized membrane protein HdeD (DUF308 family)